MACLTFASAAGQAVPTIAVSILPQSEFVARIGGDRVRILTLVGPGASPHSYEPTPRQMADLSGAAIWFSIGVEFENAILPKVKSLYPKLKIVNSARGVAYRTLETHVDAATGDGALVATGADLGASTPNPGTPASGAAAPDAHAGEGGIDPHVWLGLEAVRLQLATIRDALIEFKPADAAYFRANHDAYRREIDALFADLSKRLAPLRGATAYVYHPSFGYFLDNFGIKQEAVEVGGKEPTQKTLALLIKNAKADGAKVIFVQKQFSSAAARTVAAAIGGVVVQIDSLAGNWLENIGIMGEALKRAALKHAAAR
ncbi:MAG TPA: zinc ABC transporter substrate-binding protein [Rectinemataceae bacterium]|nr:zinc ABC transporter substrate-binding protein [Rectinemataceae bacterium]